MLPVYEDCNDPAGALALQDAIRHLHGLESTWLESVPVHEKHEGKTAEMAVKTVVLSAAKRSAN